MILYKVKLNNEEKILFDYEFVDVYKNCSIISLIDLDKEIIRIMNLSSFNFLLKKCECMTNVSLVINQKDLSVEEIINITNKEVVDNVDYNFRMCNLSWIPRRDVTKFKLFVNDLINIDNYSYHNNIFFNQTTYYQYLYDILTDKYKLLLKEKISNHKKIIKEQIK